MNWEAYIDFIPAITFGLGVTLGYWICRGYIAEVREQVRELRYSMRGQDDTIHTLKMRGHELERQLKEERTWAQALGASLYDPKDD